MQPGRPEKAALFFLVRFGRGQGALYGLDQLAVHDRRPRSIPRGDDPAPLVEGHVHAADVRIGGEQTGDEALYGGTDGGGDGVVDSDLVLHGREDGTPDLRTAPATS